MNPDRTLPWDWYPGRIPENVAVDETAYIETTFSFYFFRRVRRSAAALRRTSARCLTWVREAA